MYSDTKKTMQNEVIETLLNYFLKLVVRHTFGGKSCEYTWLEEKELYLNIKLSWMHFFCFISPQSCVFTVIFSTNSEHQF